MHSIHRAILFNISVRPSVCLSVRPVPVLRLNEWTNCHIFDVLARADCSYLSPTAVTKFHCEPLAGALSTQGGNW